MDRLVPLTEAKAHLHEVVRIAQETNVVLLRHGRPVAVVVAPDYLEGLHEELEDLRDRLSVLESRTGDEDLRVPWSKAKVELGLAP